MNNTIQYMDEHGCAVWVDKKMFNKVMKLIQQDDIKFLSFQLSVGHGLIIQYKTDYSVGEITLICQMDKK